MRILLRSRVRVQLGNNPVECGAACLAMILSYFGRQTTVQDVRKSVQPGRDGTTAAALARAARNAGLEVQPLRVPADGPGAGQLPAILHWNANHFVVLERWRPSGAVIVDPAAGRRYVDAAELKRSATGVVLVFELTPAFARRRQQRGSLIRFLRPFLPRSRAALGLILLSSALLALLGLAPAALTRYIVDTVLPRREVSALTAVGGGIAALTISQALILLGRSQLLLFLETRIDARIMTRFVRHLLSLPYSYFQLRTGGDLLVRATSTTIIRDMLTTQSVSLVLDGGLVLIYLAVLASASTAYCVIVAGVGVVQATVMICYGRRIQQLAQHQLLKLSEAQSSLLETIVGVETVKAAGAEDHAYHRWSSRFHDQLRAAVSYRSTVNLAEFALSLLTIGSPLALLWFGTQQVLAGTVSLGGMLALNAIAGSALAPVNTLANTAMQFQTVGVHLSRLQDVFLEQSEQDPAADKSLINVRGDIRLDTVTFRYSDSSPPAVRDVSLSCPAGAKIALVGATGSGKSTLARLMLGLHRPNHGTISFDGRILDELDLRHLRRQCGVVMQEPHIFSGTIYDNIAFTTGQVSREDVVQAAIRAEIHDEILAMPMGYDTMLAEGGVGLSGGQRQRLAIARALLGKPKILLFDEATSHLDALTEWRIHQNLATLRCTRIVIAHRLSTVRDADLILVLDAGTVVEAGCHDELLVHAARYAQLVNSQLV